MQYALVGFLVALFGFPIRLLLRLHLAREPIKYFDEIDFPASFVKGLARLIGETFTWGIVFLTMLETVGTAASASSPMDATCGILSGIVASLSLNAVGQRKKELTSLA